MERSQLLCISAAVVALSFSCSAVGQTKSDTELACDTVGHAKRVEACSEVIATANVNSARHVTALANRGLHYSMSGDYARAIEDYNQAIASFPRFAVALNNRAWAKFKLGQLNEALIDVEASLSIDGKAPHSFDTRAHVRKNLGDYSSAMIDFQAAMFLGGEKIMLIYQCGLKKAGLYEGPVDGKRSADLIAALKSCVDQGAACNPLPPEEIDLVCKN